MSDPRQTLDEPFLDSNFLEPDEVSELMEAHLGQELVIPTPTAFTPLGLEILFDTECEEPTKLYPPGAFELLLKDASPHHHPTVKAMNAVKRVLRGILP